MQFIQQYPIFYWDVSLSSFKDAHVLVQHNPKQSSNSSFINPSTGITHLMLAVFLKEQASFFDTLVNFESAFVYISEKQF